MGDLSVHVIGVLFSSPV